MLPSDDVSDKSPPTPAYLPYRVLGSSHINHVHSAPLLYLHTHTGMLLVPALPFTLLTVAGQGGRERVGWGDK